MVVVTGGPPPDARAALWTGRPCRRFCCHVSCFAATRHCSAAAAGCRQLLLPFRYHGYGSALFQTRLFRLSPLRRRHAAAITPHIICHAIAIIAHITTE